MKNSEKHRSSNVKSKDSYIEDSKKLENSHEKQQYSVYIR